jgi:hypothetical protein
LDGDTKYVKERVGKRMSLNESQIDLDMSCDAIKWRNPEFNQIEVTSEEKGFPLAFQRNVFRVSCIQQ